MNYFVGLCNDENVKGKLFKKVVVYKLGENGFMKIGEQGVNYASYCGNECVAREIIEKKYGKKELTYTIIEFPHEIAKN